LRSETVVRARGGPVSQLRRRPLVLVVDDDLDARTIYREYLRHVGCRVVTARDGLAALDKAVQHRPDVIVMDLAMPRLDGWEATRRLKRTRVTKKIPVLVLSAVQESGDGARAAGCSGFLAKPCSPELLWWQVRMMLESPDRKRTSN
jgi:two-component system, cell cycle response regulator DivK